MMEIISWQFVKQRAHAKQHLPLALPSNHVIKVSLLLITSANKVDDDDDEWRRLVFRLFGWQLDGKIPPPPPALPSGSLSISLSLRPDYIGSKVLNSSKRSIYENQNLGGPSGFRDRSHNHQNSSSPKRYETPAASRGNLPELIILWWILFELNPSQTYGPVRSAPHTKASYMGKEGNHERNVFFPFLLHGWVGGVQFFFFGKS